MKIQFCSVFLTFVFSALALAQESDDTKIQQPESANIDLVTATKHRDYLTEFVLGDDWEQLTWPPAWSADNKHFVVGDAEGKVLKVRLSDFRAVTKLDLGTPCTSICTVKNGYAVASQQNNQVLLLNDDLSISKKFEIKEPLVVVGNRFNSEFFAGSGRFSHSPLNLLTHIDAKKEVLWQQSLPPKRSNAAGTDNHIDLTTGHESDEEKATWRRLTKHVHRFLPTRMLMSSDGKTLAAFSNGYLCLFAVNSDGLSLISADPSVGSARAKDIIGLGDQNKCGVLGLRHQLFTLPLTNPTEIQPTLKFQFRQPAYVAYNSNRRKFFVGNSYKMCLAGLDGKSAKPDLSRPAIFPSSSPTRINASWSTNGDVILMSERKKLVALKLD